MSSTSFVFSLLMREDASLFAGTDAVMLLFCCKDSAGGAASTVSVVVLAVVAVASVVGAISRCCVAAQNIFSSSFKFHEKRNSKKMRSWLLALSNTNNHPVALVLLHTFLSRCVTSMLRKHQSKNRAFFSFFDNENPLEVDEEEAENCADGCYCYCCVSATKSTRRGGQKHWGSKKENSKKCTENENARICQPRICKASLMGETKQRRG